ncbi:MAG: methyltransferase domain-containing protein [Solirubrobacteraceae bacterium]
MRLLVVSHPAAVAENQRVYLRLLELGWDVTIVVPHRWSHEYAAKPFVAQPLEGLEGRLRHGRVLLAGRPERHVYLRPPGGLIRELRPEVAFVEEETYTPVAAQWGLALQRAGVPYGVQADENLDRHLPVVARRARRFVLDSAAFVAARSPTAADLVRRWGGTLPTPLVPHPVPEWELPDAVERTGFTIGYAGRLVPEKGVLELAEAVGTLGPPVRLLLIGDGPLRDQLACQSAVDVRTGVTHGEMRAQYAQMDVLVLPSRTTATWAEQFGRVLVEALVCGVPVVGSSSGEIPWVVSSTEGGAVFPEGDVAALTSALSALQDDPARRLELARRGRERALELFGERAAAAALDDALRQACAHHGAGREGAALGAPAAHSQADVDCSIGLPRGRWWRRAGDRPIVFATALRKLSRRGEGRLLDVGCGQGQFMARAARRFDVYGIDVSPARVARARDVTGLDTVLEGSATELPFPAGFFDVVCALDVVEHLGDPGRFFSEARRVLRPDGLLLFSTPNTASLGHRRKGQDSFMYLDPTHVSLLAPDSWRRLVHTGGFVVVRDGTDLPWDPPYFKRLPRVQRYAFLAFAQLGFLADVMFPWRLGENYWCLARGR